MSLSIQFDNAIERLVQGGFVSASHAEVIKQDHAHILKCARNGEHDDWSIYRDIKRDVMATEDNEELVCVSRRNWSHADIKLYKIWSEISRIHKLMVVA
jgi:hypothetical protein